MTNEQQISQYLAALRDSLGPVTLAEREEILLEIGAHIRDSVEEPGVSVDNVLARLGPPQKLATEYRDGLLIRQAGRSFSPLVLLHAALRLAAKGFFGTLVFFSALLGYVIGGGLILTAFAKPFIPAHVGLFAGPYEYGFGIRFPLHAGERELLGWWYIPVALVLGSLCMVLTSWAIRAFLRMSQRWQLKLGGPSRLGSHTAVAPAFLVAVVLALAAHQAWPQTSSASLDATTGAEGEYAKIPQTISPKVLDLIGDWIHQRL